MENKFKKIFFLLINLLTVIFLFTIIDHYIHGLENAWSVPEYYFKHKIPYGFLLAVIGLALSIKIKNIWLKSLIVGGFTAVTLQFNYFVSGYALDFVLIFLFIHLIILYPLLVLMFWIYNKQEHI